MDVLGIGTETLGDPVGVYRSGGGPCGNNRWRRSAAVLS